MPVLSSPASSPTLEHTSLPSSPRENLRAVRTTTPKPTADRNINADRDEMDGLHPVELYQSEKRLTIGNDAIAIDLTQPVPPSGQHPALRYVHEPSVLPVSPEGGEGQGQPAADAGDGEKRIFGFKRTTVLLSLSNILSVIVLIVVTAVLSQQIRAASSTRTSNSSQASPTPQEIPATFNGTGPHVDDKKNVCLGTAPLPKAFGIAKAECPGSNGTIFTLPGSNMMFERRCDMDLPGNDMAHVPMTDFKDCLALCAFINLGQNAQGLPCKGVTWVFGDGPQGGDYPKSVNFCFPKSRRDNLSPRAGAESAMLVD